MAPPGGYRGGRRWPVVAAGGVLGLIVFGAGVGCTVAVVHAIGGVSAVAAPSPVPLHPETAYVPRSSVEFDATPFPEPTRAIVSVAIAQAAAKVVVPASASRASRAVVQAASSAPAPQLPAQVPVAIAPSPAIHRAAEQVQFSSRDDAQDAQAQADLAAAGGRNPAPVVGYVRPSRYELGEQDFIAARLTVDVNSEHPGQVLGVVTTPAYDSATHTTLLIPAGTMLVGDDATGGTVNGQGRLLVSWRELIFPNEVHFIFPGPAEGADAMGAAGTPGDVQSHKGAQFGQAALYTLLSAVGSLVGNIGNHSQIFAPAVSGGIGTVFAQQAQSLQPTISIPQGTVVHVYATHPLALRPYAEISHD
jgi:type IV secretory pathway VirB10-like protein